MMDIDLDTVREALTLFPIAIGIVFGSQVRGETHPYSDIDIGIVFESSVGDAERRRLPTQVTAELSEAFRTNDIDVVDLMEVSPDIAYDAIRTGQLVVGTESERSGLEARMLQKKLDFAPIKREWRNALSHRLEDGEYGRV